MHLPGPYVSLSGCKGKQSWLLPVTQGGWAGCRSVPYHPTSMHTRCPMQPPIWQPPHPCPLSTLCLLLPRKMTASRGTLQQLTETQNHEGMGIRTGGTQETQEFLSVTPANPPVRRGAFHSKREGRARTKPTRSPPSTHCLCHPAVHGQTRPEPIRHFPASSTSLVPAVAPSTQTQRGTPVTWSIQPP